LWSNILPPSSGSNDKPSKKPAEAGSNQSLMGMGVDLDGEVKVRHSGGGFYMKDYLKESNFNFSFDSTGCLTCSVIMS
jgi:hypothetical protein